VELVDDELRHLLDIALGGQSRSEPRRDTQLLAQVSDLARGRQATYPGRASVTPECLGTPSSLLHVWPTRLFD
jgi:alpha-D-ribose 1-methylphosphonate 5-triphosphate synthase subunit PhnH